LNGGFSINYHGNPAVLQAQPDPHFVPMLEVDVPLSFNTQSQDQ